MKKPFKYLEQAKPQFPVRELIEVETQEGNITFSADFFGPNTFDNNSSEMSKTYSHHITGEQITFRASTTAEALLDATTDFSNRAKPKVFDPRWFQAGRIVRAQDGVYANTQIIDEAKLKALRDKCKEFNGIWLLPNGQIQGVRDFGFAPYETFEKQRDGISYEDFARQGLARVLEHTEKQVAENLRVIASDKGYKRGVSVWGFDNVKEPIARIVELGSIRFDYVDRLYVNGSSWTGDGSGYASGVLMASTESAKPAQKY